MLISILVNFVPIIIAIVLHEVAHGYAAYLLGDDTAKRYRRLSLNPVRHVDVFGTLILPTLLILSKTGLVFGWAKPVPVDMRNFKNPKRGMALTALAGPVSNVLLAYIAVVILNFLFFWLDNFGGGWLLMGLMQFFIYVEIISAGLAVFNVFPIPPLDGSKVLFALLSDRAYDKLMRYERYGMGLLMLLLITGLIDTPLGAMRDGLLQLLNSLGTWGYTLPSMLF